MDSKVSEKQDSRPLRRSTRQSLVKVLSVEPTPRGPLKRTKRRPSNQAAVNGSKNMESGSDDEESPSKKSRKETGRGGVGGSGDDDDGDEMDVQQSVDYLEKNDQLEMDVEQDSSHIFHRPTIYQGALGDVNLSPRVLLGERCLPSRAEKEDTDLKKTKRVEPSAKGPTTLSKSAAHVRSSENTHNEPILKITSMEYKKKMEAKTEPSDIPIFNHYITSIPASEKHCTTRQRMNNIPAPKKNAQHKKTEGRKKTAVIKESSRSFWGFMWYFCCLVLLVLFVCAGLHIMPKIITVLQRTGDDAGSPLRPVRLETFADRLSHLETQFLSQQPELWKRSRIHLEKHLKTAQPTEPVSLILTAGHKAEKTLHCLAQGLASAFSSALNASVLHIDGASKASQDSDEVKLYIDQQLQAAFEGDKPAAIIHRLEELPPGSTLIFYRYCDHENAAYKQVFLLFTVLLPEDEVRGDKSLKYVEEMVQDYVKDRLVGSSDQIAFNDMDIDKFGGLWSRISHLILPVVSEREIEQKGCS
ncbi:torsin-1A-interacting protein 2-like [Thunnus thynnus]|uniref:torsin-1A-interacting protein 2-like n=1 Tax=Thunnus thynnus TaxID=8237 RepID=UPI003529D0F3